MTERPADLLRRAYPRALAQLHAATRSLPDAEDALHDAVARALDVWPRDGVPDVPEAWLVAVALNRHRDRARRRAVATRHEGALAALAEMSPWARAAMGELRFARGWKDELLGLLFACCDPALEPGEAAALALTTAVGLSTAEVARAFLVAPRSMEQRLTRASDSASGRRAKAHRLTRAPIASTRCSAPSTCSSTKATKPPPATASSARSFVTRASGSRACSPGIR